ncbi:Na+/H+ antiporter [Moniliophthora roreri]|uniref:Cation/H+ exchanger transmembrane domain-containing protein n=1 Tax=Moniliophthora roreri TaxID=221103 RepID=A0A0W0FZB3_MONRR|nr:Na+/H+ antiporter [Moniliophthora roreri]
MAIELVELSIPGLAYIILGGFTVAFYTVSSLVRDKLYVNEVFLGTAFGIVMGPYGADLFDPRSWGISHKITLEVMRVVLGIGLFMIGVDLPKRYMHEHMKGLLVVIVPTMAIGWAIIAGFLKLLFPQLNFISCLAISACLTPTDPIICAAIVGGSFAPKSVSTSVRHLLSAESAANDGLAFPFLTIALYLTAESAKTVAVKKWFLIGCLYQVVLGTVIGAVLGAAFSHLMRLSLKKRLINEEAYLAQQLALPLLIIGIVSTIGSDDLLAAFAAGGNQEPFCLVLM